MTTLSDMALDIEHDLLYSDLTLDQIAAKYDIPESEFVRLAHEFYQDVSHDHLERDHDESYIPEDNWYDEQYELDTNYL